MSGGHYDYFSHTLDYFIENLEENNNPKRKTFKKLLRLISNAIHDIEWEDSGDLGENDADKAIMEVLNFLKGDSEDRIKFDCYKEVADVILNLEGVNNLKKELDTLKLENRNLQNQILNLKA